MSNANAIQPIEQSKTINGVKIIGFTVLMPLNAPTEWRVIQTVARFSGETFVDTEVYENKLVSNGVPVFTPELYQSISDALYALLDSKYGIKRV